MTGARITLFTVFLKVIIIAIVALSISKTYTIANKRIVKYRIETIDGAVDYDVDKSKTEIIAQQYRFIKSEVEKYFPNGVLDTKDAMDVLNNKVEMKDILNALNRLSE